MDNSELLICHACGEDWVRDSNHYDNRLLCPSCGSDFVQIVCSSSFPVSLAPPERERDAFPRASINPFTDHNPWAQDQESPPHPGSAAYDPMDFAFPGYSHHTYRSPDGRFSFSSSTIRGSFPPRQGAGGGGGAGAYSNPMIPMLQTLQTILGDISDAHDNDHHNHHHHTEQQYGNRSPRPEESSRRYFPDPDPAGIDEYAELEGLFPATQIDPNACRRLSKACPRTFHYNSGPRRRTGRPNPQMPMGPDPLTMLNAMMREMADPRQRGRYGDAVYSREALEEVIAQLGQQDAQGAGPPPATNIAIQSLPKRKVNNEMLGADGKAECAICKDGVELDTEVTMLPCEHWFHFDCIEAWLSRHNTCPNCRRSIDSTASPREGTRENPVDIQDSPEQQQQQQESAFGRRRRRSSPFSRSSRTSARSSFSRSSNNSPTQDANEPSRPRRPSRSEGHHRGGITGWVWSRFGGGGSGCA
ncbi:hypothetical protein N7509_010069 [Penicillium cosmopolitanum]|uniref:RING-type E3 ubiquitin transferase n=1 Tax=Penicillium cosmopolitanum TaxID=1131564 RepID=A0A9X0B471_9EURO|nr:uncharacterized protein N7509_010069 [Penicillium cosmopolitanum]KAJ5387528.1 hypothetical protein N7509_010069 [Penicillium cosmopolitanum]